ncbi:MAG: type IV secretory system conjugative DNA transfer family protein [Defluviitaleaceae bacterium]|nr:type IV secretory system conjugative DNA transfer family protein [Defluviitaleaceae bacterium]
MTANSLKFMSRNSGARWADPQEIKESSAIKQINVVRDCDGCGIPIISDGRTAYVDDSDTHSLIFGSTGSKKTRLFGMPMLNIITQAGESFITTDPKGELYEKTSGHAAAKGYNVIALNFRDLTKSSLWNPLMLPYEMHHSGKEDDAMALINDFLGTLAEPQRRNTKDPYWIDMGMSMALAYMLFFIESATKNEANLSNFVSFLVGNSQPAQTDVLAGCTEEGSIANINFKQVLTNKESEKTFACVASTASAMFAPFMIRKSLCQLLSKSDFDIRTVGKEKTAIYIIVPDEKTALHFLISVFVKQVYEALIHEAQIGKEKKLPVRVNFILDEFCNIPTIPDMPAMVSAARSRNMRFFLMTQGMYQMEQKYGKDAETIKGNCDNWVFLTSREHGLLQEISNLCGETVLRDISGNVYSRPLISISELQRLRKEKGEALILHGRQYPFMAELPDIDDYAFKKYPPMPSRGTRLPEINVYNPNPVVDDIKKGKRPILFSTDYKRQVSDIFDW